jgi:hypothetical protein
MAVRERADRAQYKQLVHLRYADAASMLTVGGIIYGGSDDISVCDFDSLSFLGQGADAYELRVPRLTFRERAALDQLLPSGDLAAAPDGLEEEDIDAYAKLYRWAPFYVDVQV